MSALEAVGVKAIREAVRTQQIVVIDEIGAMELRSALFCVAVSEALGSGAPILATLVARSLPFTDAIKRRSDITLIEVRADNREQLVSKLSDQFMT